MTSVTACQGRSRPPSSSTPESDSSEMLDRNRCSSRELSACATENERKAREGRDRAEQLKAQIDALLAQRQAAEEESKKHTEQAEAHRQSAREQSFYEESQVRQEEFRNAVAADVFTRVASMLGSTEDLTYIKAIADQKEGFEDPTDFKLMLWDAIAGSDAAFVAAAAQRVYARRGKLISDEDIDEIRTSSACLAKASEHQIEHVFSAQKETETAPSPLKDNIGNAEAQGKRSRQDSVPASGENTQDRTQNSGGPRNNTHDGPSSTNDVKGKDATIKEELHTEAEAEATPEESSPSRRHRMAEIDENVSTRQVTNATTVSTTRSFETDDELSRRGPLFVSRGRSPTPATHNKRPREESAASTARMTQQPHTPKKTRVSSGSTPGTPRVRSFARYVEDLSSAKLLQESDFHCVSCEKEIEKEPRIAACLHMYDNACLKRLRSGSSGKAVIKMRCVREHCMKDIGQPGIISVKALNELKGKYLDASNDEIEGDSQVSNGDQEMTQETTDDDDDA